MSPLYLPRLHCTTKISDGLNLLAAIIKTRSTLGLNDAAHSLETVIAKVLNQVYGLELENLNAKAKDYPAIDLADFRTKRAYQITVQGTGAKIRHTIEKARQHGIWDDFERLTIFFLLPKAPEIPKTLSDVAQGKVDTLDISGLVKAVEQIEDLERLRGIVRILDDEIGAVMMPQYATADTAPKLRACFQEEDGRLIPIKNGGGLPPSLCMDLTQNVI